MTSHNLELTCPPSHSDPRLYPLHPLAVLVGIQQHLLHSETLVASQATVLEQLGQAIAAHQVVWYSFSGSVSPKQELVLSAAWVRSGAALPSTVPQQFRVSLALRQLLTQSDVVQLSPEQCQTWALPGPLLIPFTHSGELYGAIFLDCQSVLNAEQLQFLTGVQSAIVLKAVQEQTATALHTRESHYRHLVETTNEGVWVVDSLFRTTFLNGRMAQLLGCEPYAFLGCALWDLIAPNQRHTAKELIFSLQNGQTQQWQTQIQDGDGQRIWVLISATAMISEAGLEEGVLLMVTDITPQRQAERERDRFFDISADLFCIASFDGQFKRVNPAWSKILGHSTTKILNQPYLSLVHPDDHDHAHQQALRLNEGTVCVNFQNRYRCADGSYRWLEWNAVPYRQEDCIYAVARDITAQKEIEAAQQESRQRLEAAQAVAHVGDWEMDLITGRITWSQELFRIFGITPEGISEEDGNIPAEIHSSAAIFKDQYLRQIHPDDRATTQRALQQSILNGQAYEIEQRIVRPDGEVRHLLVKGKPFVADHGQVIRVFGTVMDVTELKQAKANVQTRLARERLIARISTQFMHLDHTNLDEGINSAIAQVSELVGVDHCYICQLEDLKVRTTYQWCAPQVTLFEEPYAQTCLDDLPWIQARLTQLETINIPDVNALPAAAQAEQQFFQNLGTQAILKVPLVARGAAIGCINWEMSGQTRHWTADETTLLRLVGEIVASALEHRRSTLALLESEERFRQLAENINSVFWIRDIDSRKLLYTSPAYEQVWGRSIEELMSPDFYLASTIHPEDQARMREVFKHNMNSSYEEEYRIVRPDGKIRWVRDRAFPVRNHEGNVYRFIGVAEDVSDRKHTEDALHLLMQQTAAQIGNEFFQALIQHLAQALQVRYAFITRCLDDPATQVETLAFWTGESFGENFSYDLSNTPCEEVVYGETCFYPQGVQQAFPLDSDLVTLGVESYAAMPLFDSNHRVLGHLVIMDCDPLSDVRLPRLILQMFAARAGSELERLQSEEQLRQSEERLQLALTGSNLGLWDWHIPSNTQFYSDQWKQMLGYAPDEISNQYEEWSQRVHPDDLHLARAATEAHFQGTSPIYQVEFRMKHRSGDWRWILAHGKVVAWDEAGNPVRMTGIHQDITERKVVERMKDEFLSIMSHELRTPMTSIHGSLKLINTGKLGELSDQGQKMLAIAVSNTERLSRLINDILDLQRLESGQFSLKCQTCDVASLLSQTVESLGAITASAQVNIQIMNHDSPLQVWADPDYLMQVLTNLLSNAIKFSPEQSTITLSATHQDQQVCFKVSDRGRGIPADKLESIFQRFHQVDASDSRQKGGTGLGLAICRHIVQQHGGHIWVESEVGQGSTFSFTCPIATVGEH